jgi:peroxiredoxin
MRYLLPVILFLFIFNIQAASAIDTGLDIGQYPPAFELNDLSGKKIAPLDRKGKVILLNFWSTMCVPCVAELPSLNKLSTALKDKSFEIIAVAIDSSDTPVREVISKEKINFTVLLDPEKEVFFDLYAGPILPAGYLIDRNGIIAEKFSGPQDWNSEEVKNRIRKLLDKR